MEYITYDEYKEMGGVLDSAAFIRYSTRAFARIRQDTHSRIDAMDKVPNEVKHLCRDLIEYMHNNLNQDKVLSGTSQTQGGASESESFANLTNAEHDKTIDGLIYDYLACVTDINGVSLIYRGCL